MYEIVSRHSAQFNNVEPSGASTWHRKPWWGDRVIWPDCRYVPETFLFSRTSRPALEPTQPQLPVKCLQRPFLRNKATGAQSCSPHLVLTSKTRGVVRRALPCGRGAQINLNSDSFTSTVIKLVQILSNWPLRISDRDLSSGPITTQLVIPNPRNKKTKQNQMLQSAAPLSSRL